MNYNELIDEMIFIRKILFLTQQQLSSMLHVSRSILARAETNKEAESNFNILVRFYFFLQFIAANSNKLQPIQQQAIKEASEHFSKLKIIDQDIILEALG